MGVVALTAETFDATVERDGITLVDWWAPWCGPCRKFGPVFDAAADRYDDIVFAKVDTEQEQALAAAARIMSIPTLMVFRDGVLVYSQPGALPAAALDDLVAKVRALDMDAARRESAAAQGATS